MAARGGKRETGETGEEVLSSELGTDGGDDKSRMDGARPRLLLNPRAICVKH